MAIRQTLGWMGGFAAALATAFVLGGCSTSTSGTPTAGSTGTTTTAVSTSSAETSAPETPTTSSETLTTPMTTTSAPAETTTTTAPAQHQTYVYYAIDTRNGLRLARELRDVPEGAAGAIAAIEAMISGPLDPDYSTTWNPKTRVLGAEQRGNVISVDLSADARTANVGSGGAVLMVQQLVWTATDAFAAPKATVQLTIDGAPPGDLWGVLTWDKPVGREAPENVRMMVQIDTPRQGAEVHSPVTVTGDAAAFEANVPWRVLDSAGAVVDSGATLTSEGMTFAPFSFQVDLPPGTYTIEISEDDPSGGAAGTPSTDTRAITVVP